MIGWNVFILSGVQGDTRRYRTFHLFEQLRLGGVDCRLGHITDQTILKQADWANCLVVHRLLMDRFTEKLLNQAARRNTLVLLDVDDLLFDQRAFEFIDSPDFSDPIRAKLYQENMLRAREVLDACAGVIASTDFLAEKARECGKPAWVHRNAFSLEMMALSQAAMEQFSKKYKNPDEPGKWIGYASGTLTHNQDFALVRPALQNVLRRHPEWRLQLIGRLDPGGGWGGIETRVQKIPFRPWRELPAALSHLSINLAPLRADNPFAQSKSEIKFMEAGLVQVPTIASTTDAFSYAIQSGENGCLVNSIDGWEGEIEKLVTDPENREHMAHRAYEHIYQRYSPWVRSQEALKMFEAISQQITGKSIGFPNYSINAPKNQELRRDVWISREVELHPGLIERGLHTLRSRGMTTLIKEIWIFLRRLVAPIIPFDA